MASATLEREPVTAREEERPLLIRIDRLFEEQPARSAKLVGPDGEEIPLPETAFRLLRQVVHLLARDNAVTIVRMQKELTTQQAADLLNISRPYLITLLEQGKIPYTKTGSHRRIRFGDLMDYKQRRDAERRRGLDELTRLSEALDLYE